ncbi:unnamed protein product [Clonostachys rosea]|uniref:Rhodopsin domain-containing protein n=1 Tax=Bionectria ochroleuca TaxID=29856 RepID=A0ABY6U0N4_BIOOC|nr:unnamed protein product [Clonostachys rosea]
MDQYDPAVLATIPVMPPPEGVLPNFENPVSSDKPLAILIPIYAFFILTFTIVRVYVRARVTHALGIDDALCVVATITAMGYCGVIYSMLHGISGSLMGIHLYDVSVLGLTVEFMQSILAVLELYMATSMFVKLTILALYLRLFQPVPHINWMIRIGIVVMILFYTSCMIATLALCLPRASDGGGWLSAPQRARCDTPQINIGKLQSVFNAVSDIYVLLIPLLSVPGLRLSPRRKLGVIAIFFTGSIACIASIIGAVYRLIAGSDFTWDNIPTFLASSTELCLGIVCSCVPVVFILFKGGSQSLSAAWSSLKRYGRHRGERTTDPETQSTEDMMGDSLPKVPRATMTGLRTFIRGGRHTTHNRTEPYNELHSFDADYHLQLQKIETGRAKA